MTRDEILRDTPRIDGPIITVVQRRAVNEIDSFLLTECIELQRLLFDDSRSIESTLRKCHTDMISGLIRTNKPLSKLSHRKSSNRKVEARSYERRGQSNLLPRI